MRPGRRARRGGAKAPPSIAVARPLLQEIAQWLPAHHKLVLILLLALSVLIRAGYYFEATDGPLPYGHLWPQADMGFFDHAGRRRCGASLGVDFFAPIQKGAHACVRASSRIPLDLAPVAPVAAAGQRLAESR